MAGVPATHQAFQAYTYLQDADPPQHVGREKMFGPFVVTGNTKISGDGGLIPQRSSDTSDIPDGGIVILGEGWTSPGLTLPNDFKWGFLFRSGNNVILTYINTSQTWVAKRSNFPANHTDAHAITNFNTGVSGETTEIDAGFIGKFRYSVALASNAPRKGTLPTTSQIITQSDTKIHAYEVTESATNKVKIVHHYSNLAEINASRLRLYEIKSGNAVYSDEVEGDGGLITNSETSGKSPADTPGDDNKLAHYATTRDSMYLEDVRYGVDGKPHKSFSESYPLKLIADGGVEFYIKYWGNSPLSGTIPYEVRRIRVESGTRSNNAFWVA